MKNKTLTVLLSLFLTFSASAQSECEDPQKGLEEVSEGTAVLEELRDKLLTVMTTEEQNVVKKIIICSSIAKDILAMNAVAFLRKDTGKPVILFGYAAQVTLMEIGRAIAIGKVSGIHPSYLDGFIRYRSSPTKFHELPMTAEDFAVNLGRPGVRSYIDGMSEEEVQIGEGAGIALLMYILAHEFAHHINKDVNIIYRPPAEQQAAEELADKWAASKLRQAGIDPVIAIPVMLVLNEVEQQSVNRGTHPPALKRALTLATDSYRFSQENPAWISRYLAPISTPATLEANTKRYINSVSKLLTLLNEKLEDSARLQKDNAYLKKSAATSTKARMDLGIAYATGKRAGIPQDWELARDWMYAAQKGSDPYEYDFRAESKLHLARYHWASGGDVIFGCSMLENAAAMKHGFAKALWKKSIETGYCKIP